MNNLDLNKYTKTRILGNGADYEVSLGENEETHKSIVFKRPNPHVILKNLHASTENRTKNMLDFHALIGNKVRGISPIIGSANNSDTNMHFYEDELHNDYTVIAQKRAPGFPLNADVRARILKVPTGIGQTMFSLFPIGLSQALDIFTVPKQIMAIQTAVFEQGFIILDLNPQNVFYSPLLDTINIIDTADIYNLNGENDNKLSNKSIFDYYIEFIRYYIASEDIPKQIEGYTEPRGTRPYFDINIEINELKETFLNSGITEKMSMIDILDKIQLKAYSSIHEFNRDINAYFETIRQRWVDMDDLSSLQSVWLECLDFFKIPHWNKYDFNHETELKKFL